MTVAQTLAVVSLVHSPILQCPHCSTSRYNAYGKVCQTFTYLPLIPQLKTYFTDMTMVQKMRYRAFEHIHDPQVVKDVFDSEIYRSLLTKAVVVNGKETSYKHFSDHRDIALGLSTDGFALFRRRKKTCWPLILFNYNLPPEVRFHMCNVLSLGVIPSPKKPVDFDSFLWPAVMELLRLELGVYAYDNLSKEFFLLRAFLILVFGDIPAISMVIQMKGHNGFRPCRMCNIHGVRIPDSRQPTHYVPLDCSNHPHDQVSYDPSHLPLRTTTEFLQQAHAVQFAPNEAAADRLAKESGINNSKT